MNFDKKTTVVISNNQKIKGETGIYTELFREGLDLLHLRKYGYPEYRIQSIIEGIPVEYHKKIVLHSHYPLAISYNLGGIHITREKRNDLLFMYLGIRKFIKNKDLTISISYHSTRKIENGASYIDYFFLNSIFGSIYEGGKHAYKEPDKLAEFLRATKKKIVPLGGIDLINIDMIKEIGFNAIGLHGAIWTFENPVEKFCRIRDAFLS